MKICLSLETSGRHMGLSLFRFDGKKPVQLANFYREMFARQSEQLVPHIDKLMRAAKVPKKSLSLLAVNVGPGSFTGVRIGLAAARAIAQGLNIPLAGVSGLEAMAWEHSGLVVPKIPALSNECYFAAYENGRTKQKPVWKTEADLNKFMAKSKTARLVTELPQPNVIARIGIERYLKRPHSREFHYENAVPMYLQPCWAERLKK